MVVLAVELRLADPVPLGQQALFVLGERRRLVDEPARLELRLDVLVGFLLDRFLGLVFDLGLGLLGDLEATDVGLDTRGERVTDAVDLRELRLGGGLDVLDGRIAGTLKRRGLRVPDAADVGQLLRARLFLCVSVDFLFVVCHQASPRFGFSVM